MSEIIENNEEEIKNVPLSKENITEEIREIPLNQNYENNDNDIIQIEEQKNNLEINEENEPEQKQIKINTENENENKSEIGNENKNEIKFETNNIVSENLDNINQEQKTNPLIIEEENNTNIKLEQSKNDLNNEINEDTNNINIISNTENENDEKIESLKIDEYIAQQQQNLKSNKEYGDDDNDITSRRLTARNNNDQYLVIQEENQKNENIIDNDDDNEEEKEDENLFPFRIIGDVKKKSEKLGKYNSRYLEIDSVKGLLKRYRSSKDYPKKPKEIIDLKNFRLIRKIKRIKDFYDLEITYSITKKEQKIDRVENFRFRHIECRDKWFDSLLYLWKYQIKGIPVPKFTKNFLSFVDDRIGIIQEIGKNNEKKKMKKSEINLKNFKILNLLGVGGFGTVFKVKHILTDKIYAMKVMNKNYIIKKKYLHYIVSEFEIMKSLSGFPFILDIHYCFQSANYLYLIIDYCPGGDFTKLKSINNLRLFFAEVVLAFEHIHNHNVIYRDLKPENILLDTTGHIRVCDFNLAKSGMTKNKRADSFCGTPMYFSPELLLGKGVDYRCDIYGIGLLMYELVTGFPAYNAPSIKALYEKIKKNQINFRVSGLHGDIKDLIEKMLTKDYEERITLEEIKKHPYFKDIDFNKVLRKEYGKIETVKIHKKDKIEVKEENDNNINIKKNNEDFEYEKFKLQQQKLDDNKEYSFLDGKITVKEMNLDQKRVMKNYVREFYYIKKEDIDQTKDFKLDVKETVDISSLIMDQYN